MQYIKDLIEICESQENNKYAFVEISAYLEGLSLNELSEVQAIMWLGRDGEYCKILTVHHNRCNTISYIAGKHYHCLAMYLKKGLDSLGEIGEVFK